MPEKGSFRECSQARSAAGAGGGPSGTGREDGAGAQRDLLSPRARKISGGREAGRFLGDQDLQLDPLDHPDPAPGLLPLPVGFSSQDGHLGCGAPPSSGIRDAGGAKGSPAAWDSSHQEQEQAAGNAPNSPRSWGVLGQPQQKGLGELGSHPPSAKWGNHSFLSSRFESNGFTLKIT